MILEIFLLLSLLIVIVYKFKRWHFEKCIEQIPGEKAYPIIGNANYSLKIKSTQDIWALAHRILQKYDEYGITRFWFGPIVLVALSKPEYIEIVANNPNTTNKSPVYSMIFGDVLSGAFVTDGGNKWKELRKPLLRTLTKKYLEKECHHVFVKRSNEFVDHINKHECGQEFNVLQLVSRLLIDIFSETHLGVQLNEMKENRFNYIEHFDEFLDLTFYSIIKYHFYFWKLCTRFSSLGKALKKSREEVIKFHKWVLDERKKCAKECRDGIELYPDFILRRSAERKLPPVESCKELGDVIIGGSDTSTVVTASSLLFLAMFPKVQEKVFEEQLSIFGNSSREPNGVDVAAMTYLTQVVKETLRLVGPPGIVKSCTEDIQIDKYTIPKGAMFYLAVQKVHRDPKYWEKPDDFFPNHFLPENEAVRPRYAYFPFGCGPRMCPGFNYGITAIKVVLSTILRNFKLTTSLKYENIEYDYKLFLQIKPGYYVKFEKRNKT